MDFAKKTGANFLTNSIFEIVKYEVANGKKVGKVISEPRIWNNLLSSQPLAFNLFGELKLDKQLARQVFSELYPEFGITSIIEIEFEHSPGRKNLKYTGDSSAFDVFVEYLDKLDNKSFLGIEVKYSENLKDNPSSHKRRYEEISTESGFIDLTKIEDLKKKPVQQIWRDHLLTLSLFITNLDYKRGDFIYLFPMGNNECVEAIKKYQKTFLPDKENYFKPLTIEKLTEKIKDYCSKKWIIDFKDRYLNFDKIEMSAGNTQ
ncbi:MAG: hypothetical protein IMY72_13040 [Bacteroidetes bacterium]|nr:hypothetical protein [Bacteroidota bacterium]